MNVQPVPQHLLSTHCESDAFVGSVKQIKCDDGPQDPASTKWSKVIILKLFALASNPCFCPALSRFASVNEILNILYSTYFAPGLAVITGRWAGK